MPRPLEVLLAVLALLLLSPVLALTALAVAVSSRGGVLYRQSRVGRDGVPFRLLKFRTMHEGSAQLGRLTLSGDSRVTPVGRFLRDHRLDELPQLVNVVRGDMSLVGARPELPEFVDPESPAQQELRRHRPGLTDPASLAYRHEAALLTGRPDVEAYYREVVLPDKLRRSVAYANRRTLGSDLHVLLQTAACLLLPRLTPADAPAPAPSSSPPT